MMLRWSWVCKKMIAVGRQKSCCKVKNASKQTVVIQVRLGSIPLSSKTLAPGDSVTVNPANIQKWMIGKCPFICKGNSREPSSMFMVSIGLQYCPFSSPSFMNMYIPLQDLGFCERLNVLSAHDSPAKLFVQRIFK